MKKYLFYKEESGRWYVDLPEWTGSKAELEMVAGADKMLDIICCKGTNKVTLNISLEPFENSCELKLLREDPEIGGGFYLLEKYHSLSLNLEMWLCEVTRFVFDGILPQKIYFKSLGYCSTC